MGVIFKVMRITMVVVVEIFMGMLVIMMLIMVMTKFNNCNFIHFSKTTC